MILGSACHFPGGRRRDTGFRKGSTVAQKALLLGRTSHARTDHGYVPVTLVYQVSDRPVRACFVVPGPAIEGRMQMADQDTRGRSFGQFRCQRVRNGQSAQEQPPDGTPGQELAQRAFLVLRAQVTDQEVMFDLPEVGPDAFEELILERSRKGGKCHGQGTDILLRKGSGSPVRVILQIGNGPLDFLAGHF